MTEPDNQHELPDDLPDPSELIGSHPTPEDAEREQLAEEDRQFGEITRGLPD